MKGTIRSVLAVTFFALVWSCFTFVDDGFIFFVPHVGGYYFSYDGE